MPAVGCFIVCLPDQLQDGLRVDGLWLIARGKWWRIMQLLTSAPCKWWRCVSIPVSWLFAYTNKACVRLYPSVKANENITSFAQNWPYSRWSTSLPFLKKLKTYSHLQVAWLQGYPQRNPAAVAPDQHLQTTHGLRSRNVLASLARPRCNSVRPRTWFNKWSCLPTNGAENRALINFGGNREHFLSVCLRICNVLL